MARPTIITPQIIEKLEQAFALGCTDLEACFYADISKTALYEYQEKHPEFTERKEELKMKPVLQARMTVMKGINGYEIKDKRGKVIKVINAPNPKLALEFLTKKMHKEFKQGVDHSGNVVFDKEKHKSTMAKWFVGGMPRRNQTDTPAPAKVEKEPEAGAENEVHAV